MCIKVIYVHLFFTEVWSCMQLNVDKAFKSHNATGFFAQAGEPRAEGDSRVGTGRELNNKELHPTGLKQAGVHWR